MAMREGAAKDGLKLLEPIMDVEVMSPGSFFGSVGHNSPAHSSC